MIEQRHEDYIKSGRTVVTMAHSLHKSRDAIVKEGDRKQRLMRSYSCEVVKSNDKKDSYI